MATATPTPSVEQLFDMLGKADMAPFLAQVAFRDPDLWQGVLEKSRSESTAASAADALPAYNGKLVLPAAQDARTKLGETDKRFRAVEVHHAGLAPAKAVPRQRESAIAAFLKEKAREEERYRVSEVVQSFFPEKLAHSTASMSTLSQVLLRDMLQWRSHDLLDGLKGLLEDETGRVERFEVYNMPLPGVEVGSAQLQALFPIGQYLLIKEPQYLEHIVEEGAVIRVDSPSDIVFIQSTDQRIPSTWKRPLSERLRQKHADFKAAGNTAYAATQFFLAVKYYTEGIESSKSSKDLVALHLNRSAAHLKLRNFKSAYLDATAALELLRRGAAAATTSLAKALYRRGQAEEKMQLFEQAKQSYYEVLAVNAGSKEAGEAKNRMDRRPGEQYKGDYDWVALFNAQLDFPESVGEDVATFVGPLEVRTSSRPGGGRGMFATRDVAPGELLLCEKSVAIGCIEPSDKVVRTKPDPRPPCGNFMIDVPVLHALRTAVIARSLDDPSFDKRLNLLFAGPEWPVPQDAPDRPSPSLLQDVDEVVIDPEKVKSIIAYNCFALERTERVGEPSRHEALDETNLLEQLPVALFLHASLFNHSCVPNTAIFEYSDIMVVRASRHIKAAEEVFVAYADMNADFVDRQKRLRRHFPMGCDCPLCCLDAEDGLVKLNARAKIRNEAAEYSMTKVLSSKVMGLVSDLSETYRPSRPLLRPEMTNVYLGGAKVFKRLEGRVDDMVERYARMLRSLGVEGQLPSATEEGRVDAYSAGAAFHALTCARDLQELGFNEMAAKWTRFALKLNQVSMGGDKDLFLARYGPWLEKKGLSAALDKL